MQHFNSYDDFYKALVVHLATFNPGKPGYYPQCKKYYPHIVDIPLKASKRQKENIIKSIIREDSVVPDLYTSPHMYAHHLNSSQVVCYEFFRPLISADKQILPRMQECLSRMGLPQEKFDEGHAEFEWIPYPKENTNFDFYVQSNNVKAFFEIKYTERGFGPCKNDEEHRKKFKDIYEPMIECCACLTRKPTFDEFRKNYQLFRNTLRITKENWQDEYVIFLFPKENSIAQGHFEAFLQEFVAKEFHDRVISVHWEDMTEFMSDRFHDKFFFYTL